MSAGRCVRCVYRHGGRITSCARGGSERAVCESTVVRTEVGSAKCARARGTTDVSFARRRNVAVDGGGGGGGGSVGGGAGPGTSRGGGGGSRVRRCAAAAAAPRRPDPSSFTRCPPRPLARTCRTPAPPSIRRRPGTWAAGKSRWRQRQVITVSLPYFFSGFFALFSSKFFRIYFRQAARKSPCPCSKVSPLLGGSSADIPANTRW